MACCGGVSSLQILTAVRTSSTSPGLGRFTRHGFPSLRSSATLGVLSVSSRSASLLPCQDGRRNEPASNEEATPTGAQIVEEEKAGEELDMSTLEKALARSFGTALWYTVLIVCLAIFGGGYVYLLLKYGDFGAVPILGGPDNK